MAILLPNGEMVITSYVINVLLSLSIVSRGGKSQSTRNKAQYMLQKTKLTQERARDKWTLEMPP